MKRSRCCAFAAATFLCTTTLPAADAPNPLEILLGTLARIENPAAQANILRGANASLKGRRDLKVPANWDALYARLKDSPDEQVRRQAQALAVTFGGGAALAEMRRTLGDANATAEARGAALDSLLAVQDKDSLPLVLGLIRQPGPLQLAALRGLAVFDDRKVPGAIIAVYSNLDAPAKREALNTLLARPGSARALLEAVDAKKIPRTDIAAPLARQLQAHRDGRIDEWLAANWGAVRTSSAEKQKQIAKFKEFLGTDAILRADASHGRQLFTQTCAVCHTMFGEGGKIGPELPGSFEDIDYLLQNILDPNATIGKDYQQTFITTKDGQLVAGIVVSEDDQTVVLKSLAGPVTVQRSDVTEKKTSEASMMPEGLLLAYDEQGVRDLFLYLRQRQQVSLPAGK